MPILYGPYNIGHIDWKDSLIWVDHGLYISYFLCRSVMNISLIKNLLLIFEFISIWNSLCGLSDVIGKRPWLVNHSSSSFFFLQIEINLRHFRLLRLWQKKSASIVTVKNNLSFQCWNKMIITISTICW